MDNTLTRQEENLKEHMRRTELAERQLEVLRLEVKPIQRHVTMIEGVLKFLGALSLLVGLVLGVAKLLELF